MSAFNHVEKSNYNFTIITIIFCLNIERSKKTFYREIAKKKFRMSNDFIDDDSLDLDLSDANHTSQLYNLNQRLLFKGYNSILDETGELNQKTLEETLDKLLQRDSQLLKVNFFRTEPFSLWSMGSLNLFKFDILNLS